MKELLDVLERFDVELVLVRRAHWVLQRNPAGSLHSSAQLTDLIREIPGNSSFVEHVHEEIVDDDIRTGNVLSGRLIAAASVNVKLLNLKSILLLREATKESKSLAPPRQINLKLGSRFEMFVQQIACILFHLRRFIFHCVIDVKLDNDLLAIIVFGERDFATGYFRLKPLDSGKDVVVVVVVVFLLQIDLSRQKLGQFLISLGQKLVHRPRSADERALRETDAAVLNPDFRGDSSNEHIFGGDGGKGEAGGEAFAHSRQITTSV